MGKKILLIDDDHDLGRLVDVVLRPLELTVYQSYSGQDGLRKFYDIHPDLVILDVMMPGMDGFSVCARLREMSSVPILMLTCKSARGDAQSIIRGIEAGANDYLQKPILHNDLVAKVRSMLGVGVEA